MAGRKILKKSTIFPYIVICFILSGCASLALEVTWSKYLSLLLGGTIYGVSTVVGAFMAGLGLGSYIAGKLSTRIRNHILAYAWLEGVVGFFAVLSPFIFKNIDPLFDALYDLSLQSLTVFLIARFSVLFLLLMIPTIAMGASLPLLTEYFARREPGHRGYIGTLYALNTLGAVMGTLLAGFYLVPKYGLAQSTLTAGFIDIAILVFLLIRRFPEAAPMEPTEKKALPIEQRAERKVFRLALEDFINNWKGFLVALLFGFSGLVAMIYQIGWTRVLIIFLGSSVYSFTIILSLYLVGLSLGSALVARFAERARSPLTWFGLLEGIVALAAYFGSYWLENLSELTSWSYRASEGSPPEFFLYITLIAAPVVLPPTLALGALFPLAARSYREVIGRTGKAVGTVYAANTLGTILGSLGAGFMLVPNFGARQSILMAAVASAAIGLLALVIASPARRLKFAAAAISVAAITGSIIRPPLVNLIKANYGLVSILRSEYNTVTSSSSSSQDKKSPQPNESRKEAPALERLIYFREGLNATVAVSCDDRDRFLLINGKGDASTMLSDMTHQTMVGHIPMMFYPKARDVFIIGSGIGVTTRAVLSYPDVQYVETGEIEPAVIEATAFFTDVNHDPFKDPRSHLIIEDARVWLSYTDQKYDVIISEPSNPWIAGINNLFTLDFYHQVDQKLRPGGIFCQWIHTYEISEESIYLVLRTLNRVFSDAHLFHLSKAADLLIIARKPPYRTPPLDEVFSIPSVVDHLASVGVHYPYDLGRFYKSSLKNILAEHGEGIINTDNNCHLEHRAPLELINPYTQLFTLFIKKSYFDDYHQLFFPDKPAGMVLFQTGKSAAVNGDIEYAAWALEICEDRELEESAALLRKEVDKARRRKQIRDTIQAYLKRAEVLWSKKQLAEAMEVLKQAGMLDPKDNEVLARAAMILMELQQQKPAEQAIQLLIQRGDPDYQYVAHVNLGIMLLRRQAFEEALSEFRKAQEINPYLGPSYQYAAMTLDRIGRTDEAIAHLQEGLMHGPEDVALLSQSAFLLEKKGRHKEARKLRRKAARLAS